MLDDDIADYRADYGHGPHAGRGPEGYLDNSVEALYAAHEELQEHRVVLIMNANTLATEEGAVDTSRLFHRLEERARQLIMTARAPWFSNEAQG